MSGNRAVSTTWRRELSSNYFFPNQGKAPKEIHTILTETVCFHPGMSKTYQHPCICIFVFDWDISLWDNYTSTGENKYQSQLFPYIDIIMLHIMLHHASRITAAEMKYMRRTTGYTGDRLQNKVTHCKGIRNNTGSRQTTGIQEELDTTCKQIASRQTTQDNETLFPNWQKESWQTSEETSRYVRLEWVNKWPNSMTDIWWWWCYKFRLLYRAVISKIY